jgi:hypothetical protein
MASVTAQITNGFWVGLGFALAFLVWSTGQMLFHRAEGH